jgi:hypothetical protein
MCSCIAPSLALKWEAEVKEYPEKKRKNWKSSLINSVGMKTLVRYVPKHDKEAYQSNFVEKVKGGWSRIITQLPPGDTKSTSKIGKMLLLLQEWDVSEEKSKEIIDEMLKKRTNSNYTRNHYRNHMISCEGKNPYGH